MILLWDLFFGFAIFKGASVILLNQIGKLLPTYIYTNNFFPNFRGGHCLLKPKNGSVLASASASAGRNLTWNCTAGLDLVISKALWCLWDFGFKISSQHFGATPRDSSEINLVCVGWWDYAHLRWYTRARRVLNARVS